MTRRVHRMGAALLAAGLSLGVFQCAHAEASATTGWRTQVSAGFARYERAWAAFQMNVTSRQYDVGDEVMTAAVPTTQAALFAAYRLAPAPLEGLAFQTVAEPVAGNSDGSRVRLCATATLRNAAELDGFLQGIGQSKAALATSTCQPGVLTAGFSYPVQVHAFKVVRALRAVRFIERDQAERAAQVAVADVIGFALPEGKVLDMAAQPGQSSGDYSVVLYNNSAMPWALGSAAVKAPFAANVVGCGQVLPGMSCTLTVSFVPTAKGRFMDFVTVTPVAGRVLSLRVGGTAP